MIRINDLGNFDNISEVWNQYPEGGKEGDYLTINGVEYGWDKYALLWVNGILLNESAARYNTVFDGNVIVQNNLTVAGTLRAKRLKQPNMGLFATEDALRAAIPTPEVGMWATVGDTVPGAIYRCDTVGEWTATGETGGVDNPEYDSVVERLEQLLLRMQGRGDVHDNTFDPFYYKEFTGGESAYADVRDWLDSLHSTEGGAKPLNFLRLYVNGAWLYVLQNVLGYAEDVYTQTIINGHVAPDGSIRPGRALYTRVSIPLSSRTSEDDVWEDWVKIYDSTDISVFYSNMIAGKFAPLIDNKVPASNLPAYVDEILEYPSMSAFPAQGGDAKIYLALDTNLQYRWSGSQYSEVSPSLALGETSSTAFAGDRGKALETAQTTLAASVASAVQSVETLSGVVNGKAAQADVTALANRMKSAESDIDNLETAVSGMATKSGDNTFTGDNTFEGDTTLGNVTADGISILDGSITLTDGDNTTTVAPSYVEAPIMQRIVNGVGKDLATVEEMNTALATKASTEALQTEALRAQNAEQALSLAMVGKAATVELTNYLTQGSILPWAGVYLYSGRTVSHLRVTQDGPTSYSIVFCVEHIDAMEHIGTEYHLYTTGDSAEGWTYVDSYDDETVPDYILRLFGENEATTQYPGRMSTNDKSHLNTLWDERGQGGGSSDTFATAFAALTSSGGVIRMGDNFMNFEAYHGGTSQVYWGVLKALLLNTSTEGSVHAIENDNHYTNQDTNYIYNEVYSDDAEFSLSETTLDQDLYAFICVGSNVVIKSGHDLYAVALNIRYLGGASSSVTLNIADEDNTKSITVALSVENTFTPVILDYGNTPLASEKKIYITNASGAEVNIMLQPTLKFIAS